MHIILTHEQADFDALASLLGAHLLDERAVPVLPRRMNRNVRAYITLYGLDLPFVDPRDLPKRTSIEQVTLVDTQSLVTVKGLKPDAKVNAIDHHPPRPDTPPGWRVTTDNTGATATLLVEALQEHGSSINMIQATLLLLGIYEDTGSLTYTRTTPRDLHAAAFLLDHGASLQIANEFLNHPLSPDQQALYDKLRLAAETLRIHGHSVVIACGDAGEMDEELSTLAHKMRDLLDPDAVVLIISTRGGIQLIARSTTDYINVADVATHFGGGGHPRAAAARVHDRTLEEVNQEVMDVLPGFVRPAITVAEIMSLDPQLLSPKTPVQDAATLMQRYGFEGYPIVEGDKVVGLLTRRAVDRALSHRLNLTAGDLMTAGEVTIQTGESLETLQKLMTESSWGQIPVIDPKDGGITGIVTRTDLLKILSSPPIQAGRRNLADHLERALPAARLSLLKAVATAALEQNVAFFIVGGFVRDLLLERPSQDYDLVVEGDAIALAERLAKTYGGRVTTHKRFGTAKWLITGIRSKLADHLGELSGSPLEPGDLPETLDLVTARREFYERPTALPVVERGSIKLDLHRRDFTINTLALRLDGRHYGDLLDHWGGLDDIHNRLVRVLHSLSFVDDPTRILRAVRFEQRFEFELEERTLKLLTAALPLLDRVSGDRIRHELDTVLIEPCKLQMLSRLADLNILPAIHPALSWDDRLMDLIRSIPSTPPGEEWGLAPEIARGSLDQSLSYILWLLHLSPNTARQVCSRLKMRRRLTSAILAASKLTASLPDLRDASPSTVTERLDETPSLALYAVYLAVSDEIRKVINTYISSWKEVKATLTGDDLRARGLPPGPVYKQILKALRAARLDGQVSSTEEETALLEKMLTEHPQ
jgi:tRNA nucleotidyltransferase (CCA-adding enzyme)